MRGQRDGNRLARPGDERLGVFDDVRGYLVVRHHRFGPLRKRHESRHVARGVVRAVAGVRFEERRIVVDDPEEQLPAVEPHAAKHPPRTQPLETRELLEDVREVLRLNGHQGVRNVPSADSSARSALISGAAALRSNGGAALQSYAQGCWVCMFSGSLR